MSHRTRFYVLSFCLSLLFATAVWNQSLSYSVPQESTKVIHWPEGKRVAVSLSFDDGRASQVDIGFGRNKPHRRQGYLLR